MMSGCGIADLILRARAYLRPGNNHQRRLARTLQRIHSKRYTTHDHKYTYSFFNSFVFFCDVSIGNLREKISKSWLAFFMSSVPSGF
jgi:hypothetical protein